MALLFMDGFDHYGDAQLSDKWDSDTAGYEFVAGRIGGQAFKFRNTIAGFGVTKNITPAVEEVIVGFAMNVDSIGIGDHFLVFRDSNGSRLGQFKVTSGLNIAVTRNTTTIATGPTNLSEDTWYHVEIRYIPNNTTGVFEVRLNGVPEITFSGDTTDFNEDIRSVGLERGSTTANVLIDDFYILDASGTTNNTYLGDCRIKTELPTADTSSADFTPSSGTDHYAMVDDSGTVGQDDILDYDTTYVENGSIGATDRYTSDALGITGTVYGVQVSTTAAKTDTESRKFKATIKSGTTTKEDLTEHTLNIAYNTFTDPYDVDPATGSAWTVSAVDALEFGFKVTT